MLNEMKCNLKGSKSERGASYKFKGLHPLKKSGQCVEIEDVNVAEEPVVPHVFVEKEHVVEAVSSKFSDEDVYVVKFLEYEDTEAQEVENDIPEEMNLLTTENLDTLLENVKTSIGNPPSAPSFTEQEPPLDVAADLVPQKKKKKRCTTRSGEQVIRSDKEKNVFPKDELIDIVKLQSRVFELEQDSLSHTLLIQELKQYDELKEK
ncbi:hypothetical protein R6Q57_013143 [Mikania cordata]